MNEQFMITLFKRAGFTYDEVYDGIKREFAENEDLLKWLEMTNE